MRFLFLISVVHFLTRAEALSTLPTGRTSTFPLCALTPRKPGNLKLFDDGLLSSISKVINDSKNKFNNFVNIHEHSAVGRFLSPIFRIPPLTLSYIAASTLISLVTQFDSESSDISPMIKFDANKILKQYQLWRLVTPYLYFGPLFMPHLFMCHYLATYMGSLESDHKLAPAKFVEFLLFGITSLSGIALIHDVAARSIFDHYMRKNLRNRDYLKHLASYESRKRQHIYTNLAYYLSNYMLYYWSRLNEGTSVNCYNLFTVKAEYIPYVFILQNYLLYKEISPYDPIAIALGYIYFSTLAKRPPIKLLATILPGDKSKQ
ncbi:Der1-like family [Babesia microti strain RI]|uniref:Derlin n=1 Tax=Babesia microti (strain RI) TaxID=1133968 RepID=I7JDA8_BABMR|nr:Der1-like family [Babesia microti strain RI]CCF75685.1 Der1-like family [Babesia microti strain RI]|eukprot:XP_012650093.1 Der1-like family [Babesia microti strain RI]